MRISCIIVSEILTYNYTLVINHGEFFILHLMSSA